MKEDDLEKLKSHILKTGFPTEIEVGNLFLEQGWDVEYSSFYIDKDENKGREIDLITDFTLSHEENVEEYLEVNFNFVIEVKKEKTKPWVVFMTEANHIEKAIGLPKTIVSRNILRNHLNRSFHKGNQTVHDKIGRNAIEGFNSSSKRDKIFSSLCNTTKAVSHATQSSFIKKDESTDKLIAYFEPVIVVDGELISACFDDKQELSMKEENYLQMKFNYLSPNYPEKHGRIIHVVKLGYLSEFIKTRTKQFQLIFDDLLISLKPS
jgi:hypothetical protein